MIIKIKTKEIEFEFSDPNLKMGNYFGTPDNQKAIDYIKQLISTVTEQSVTLALPS